MWIKKLLSVWQNPSGLINLTNRVYEQYRAVFEKWQQEWYEQHPDVDSDPKWYTRPNPEAAKGYPPGFLKRNLDVFVIYLASSPDVDGFFWANNNFVVGVDSYDALNAVLEQMPGPVEMLILSGERLQVEGDVCGICWREFNENGFTSDMPQKTADLIRSRVKENGVFVVGSCHAGDNPALVQAMADRVGRPVTGACGISRGVRDELLEEDGIYWTMGGYAEDKAYTLMEPSRVIV